MFLMKVFEVGGQEVVTGILAECFVRHGHNVSIASFQRPNPLMLERLDKRISVFTLGDFSCSRDIVDKVRNILTGRHIDIVINQWGLPYVPARVLDKAGKGLNFKTIAVYHNSPDTNARIKDVEIQMECASNRLERFLLSCKKSVFRKITGWSMRYVYRKSDLYMVLSPSFVSKFKCFTGIKNPTHLVVQTNPVTIDASKYDFSIDRKAKEII